MHIKSMKIRNFRNFKNVNIAFNEEDNIIIGDNGSGKTNLFNAIRLVLDYNYKLPNYLTEKDFNRKEGQIKFGEWIVISVCLTDFDEDGGINNLDFSREEDGNSYINFIYRPKLEILNFLYETSNFIQSKTEGYEEIKEEFLISSRSYTIENDYEIIRTFGNVEKLFNDNEYKDIIGNFEEVKLSNDNYSNVDYYGKDANVIRALRKLNVTYIPPIRDVRENLASSSGMFASLINKQFEEVKKEDLAIINENVLKLNNSISELETFSVLKDNLHNQMDIVGKNYFNSKFEIESNISNDKKEIVKNLNLKIYDYESVVDIWRKSLGEANIIFFALKLLESETIRNKYTDPIFNILLIEEPEAHIHGHLQKSLFYNLKNIDIRQIFITTHSVNLSEVSKISKMNILNNEHLETIPTSPSEGLNTKDIIKIERYLDANRSMLLFSNAVIMVEGDAENIIVPWLIRRAFGITLDELGISLINVNSTFFQALLPLFDKQRLRKKCSVITDLDKDHTSDKSKSDKEKNGLERKEKLDVIQDNNDYIKVFYAEYTFEIELFKDDNINVLIDMVESEENYIYSQKEAKSSKVEKLKDSKTCLETILEVIEYKKKGWFALEFITYCEQYNIEPIIPTYILSAFLNIIINSDNISNIQIIVFNLVKKQFDDKQLLTKIQESKNLIELTMVLDEIISINDSSYLFGLIKEEIDKYEAQ